MSEEKKVIEIVNDAASNVACESGEVSFNDRKKIAEQLMGMSKSSDDSFIYGLVKNLNKGDNNGRKAK